MKVYLLLVDSDMTMRSKPELYSAHEKAHEAVAAARKHTSAEVIEAKVGAGYGGLKMVWSTDRGQV